jgi:hypothetical protein
VGSIFGEDVGGSRFDNLMFIVVPLIIGVVAVFIVSVIGFGLIRALVRWNRNNHSPRVTVPASVVTKRGSVSGGGSNSSSSTTYFATFEIQGGERIEFLIAGREFGMLVEQDRGQLSYQGTRYQGFARTPQDR